MHSVFFLPLLASLATSFPTTPYHAYEVAKAIVARAPPEANAVIKSVTSSGTGCAGNSASFLIEEGATVAFDAMVVDFTETNPAKSCLVILDLQLNPKWKYTINKATDIRGFIDGASATYKVVYTVSGKTSQASGSIKATNAPDGTYFIHAQQDSGATSACGGGVATMDVSLRLAPQTQGLVTIDNMDIAFEYSQC
ncbi:hypothetical protein P154DRAFT_620329 [Amniculicola lignicola CBS 123094]|uniref:Ubiquitin 3 binding protein But2 C-terminal domain-containing protein n=1 Tax=Amniculicola lignicola CBS 123094 TaxID=1392246 RepID=A0A6A5WJ58_9PLEO|nr:hypothetical protein P154DRAFT_620329 [Amniculicola lignicola CBS 123094]